MGSIAPCSSRTAHVCLPSNTHRESRTSLPNPDMIEGTALALNPGGVRPQVTETLRGADIVIRALEQHGIKRNNGSISEMLGARHSQPLVAGTTVVPAPVRRFLSVDLLRDSTRSCNNGTVLDDPPNPDQRRVAAWRRLSPALHPQGLRCSADRCISCQRRNPRRPLRRLPHDGKFDVAWWSSARSDENCAA